MSLTHASVDQQKSKTTLGASGLSCWTASIVNQARLARSTTIGLMAASRAANDRRVIDRLAKSLALALRDTELDPRMLVVRLDVRAAGRATIGGEQAEQMPAPNDVESPLGRWRQVDVAMPVGNTAPPALVRLPRWLPKWKERFGLILLDLGPMHMVPSRSIGRLCDSCYLLLGPDTCASQAWILRHLAWHRQSGSQICGTLVSQTAA